MRQTISRTADMVRRFRDGDVYFSFRSSNVTVLAALWTMAIFIGAVFAPWFALQNPFDPVVLDLLDAFSPPVWQDGGSARFPLGTDDQGRDMFSSLLYGTRISLIVGFAATILGMVVGVGLGLVAGYVGGTIDGFLMRIADIQISVPGVLLALLIDGIARGLLPKETHDAMAIYVLIFAIATTKWVQFARTVRASTMVEKHKEYVLAAQVIGRRRATIMLRHILPNVMGPVLVIATIGLASAITLESTLSFLGVGMPPTEPSLGRMIRLGYDFLLSGEWWLVAFPSVTLATLVLAVNLLGDWMRDALNPKLR